MAPTADQPQPNDATRGPRAAPRTPGRRAHPSHGARVVALVGSVVATMGAGAGMAYADHVSSTATTASTASAASSSPAASASGTASSSATASSSESGATSTAPAAGAATAYADGVYTGAAEYTRWGDVQVQVTVKNGKIVTVAEVQAPSDGKSQRINSAAQPVLESEAVAQQSAHLDIVSGATYTSRAYAASLQAALDKAVPATPASA